MLPLVSCIMLTYNRFEFFKNSLLSFNNQNYQNKELVIIDSGDKNYQYQIDKEIKGLQNIIHIKTEPLILGELRNLGLSHSSGEYILIFDDDDIHHQNRISYSIKQCLDNNADGILFDNLYIKKTNRFFLCNFNGRGLEPTLLCKHPKGKIKYNALRLREDTKFIKDLKYNNYKFIVLDNPPELFIYNFHNSNITSTESLYMLLLKTVRAIYSEKDFPGIPQKTSSEDLSELKKQIKQEFTKKISEIYKL